MVDGEKKSGVWSLESGGKNRSAKCEVGRGKCEVRSAKLEERSAKCEVGREKCEVRSAKLEVLSWKCEVRSFGRGTVDVGGVRTCVRDFVGDGMDGSGGKKMGWFFVDGFERVFGSRLGLGKMY